MSIRINKKSNQLALVVDEGTVKSINCDKPWNDYGFNCPSCNKDLVLNSMLLVLDEFNESSWLGDCPMCNVKIKFNRPD